MRALSRYLAKKDKDIKQKKDKLQLKRTYQEEHSKRDKYADRKSDFVIW